jgi:hypothetical protein
MMDCSLDGHETESSCALIHYLHLNIYILHLSVSVVIIIIIRLLSKFLNN